MPEFHTFQKQEAQDFQPEVGGLLFEIFDEACVSAEAFFCSFFLKAWMRREQSLLSFADGFFVFSKIFIST
jgi:hypothetical protein